MFISRFTLREHYVYLLRLANEREDYIDAKVWFRSYNQGQQYLGSRSNDSYRLSTPKSVPPGELYGMACSGWRNIPILCYPIKKTISRGNHFAGISSPEGSSNV